MAERRKSNLLRTSESDLLQPAQKATTPVQNRLVEAAAQIGASPADIGDAYDLHSGLTHIGTLPLFKELTKQQPEPPQGKLDISKASMDLVGTGELIRQEPGTSDNAAFMHVVLCHLGMPRSRRSERSYERSYTTSHFQGMVLIDAGKLFNGKHFVEHPLPYGVKPRLIFMNIITTAIRTKSRVVEIGCSRREYMLRLNIDPQGSEYRSFNKQILSLAACRMQMGFTYQNGRVLNIDAKPIETFDAWLVPDGSNQQTLWPGTLELSEKFYNGLEGALVPLDERAALALDGALELDIYFWLSQRLCRINDRKGQFVTWKALKDQFGQDYKYPWDFKKDFIKALRQVLCVYPDARVNEPGDETGLLLCPSRPPIPKTCVSIRQRCE